MAEMQTFAEAKKQQRMCDGEGYRNMAPLCPGRAVKTINGKQYCQRHIKKIERSDHVEQTNTKIPG